MAKKELDLRWEKKKRQYIESSAATLVTHLQLTQPSTPHNEKREVVEANRIKMNTFKAKKEREGDDSRVETTLEHNNRKKEGEKKN